jgi:hypothetical protein
MTVTYELQNALKPEQYRAVGQIASTYGPQRFRFDEKTNISISITTLRACGRRSSSLCCARRGFGF